MEARAGRGRRAVDTRGDVVAAGARDVLPGDVGDAEARGVAAVARVDAGRDIDGLVDVVDDNVLEGDVADVARARVGLDPGGVGRVVAGDVLEPDVVDKVGLAGVGADGADASAARFIWGGSAEDRVIWNSWGTKGATYSRRRWRRGHWCCCP